jgi:hypothetical protein
VNAEITKALAGLIAGRPTEMTFSSAGGTSTRCQSSYPLGLSAGLPGPGPGTTYDRRPPAGSATLTGDRPSRQLYVHVRHFPFDIYKVCCSSVRDKE